MIADNEHIDDLVNSIVLCQSQGNAIFPQGIFPAYRQNSTLFYKRADTNIFYTATIVFVLNQLKKNLSEKNQICVASITEQAIENYQNFQNKDGLKTYNFWQTKPSKHFPNGYIFQHLEHFRIPDDIDDTALAFLTLPHNIEDTIWLKEKLKQHANLSSRKIQNTFLHYKHLKVYSTWFGKNMPIEFDACALCNLMCLFEHFQLPYNEFDEATFGFLRGVILNNEFIDFPFKVSHNYATSSLIIYHYARLIGDFACKKLDDCRPKLIKNAKILLEKEKNLTNRQILETSLMKLEKKISFDLNKTDTIFQSKPSPYFIAGLLSAYENRFVHSFASLPITQMQWQCPAHDLVLKLENNVLKYIYL